MHAITRTAAIFLLAAFAIVPNLKAAEIPAEQRLQIETVIREYLLANPELLRDMSNLLQEKERVAEEQQRTVALKENAHQIFRDEGDYVAGNPNGSVTMVEFFDYNCGWCKKGFAEIVNLLETDKELRLVLKEFPIFGEDSEYAARAAIAAKQQGKYWELHSAMFAYEGKVTKEAVDEIASAQGLDMAKLKTDMESAATTGLIARNQQLAQQLAVNGTPAFIVDDKLYPGYLPQKDLAASIDQVRQNGCNLC